MSYSLRRILLFDNEALGKRSILDNTPEFCYGCYNISQSDITKMFSMFFKIEKRITNTLHKNFRIGEVGHPRVVREQLRRRVRQPVLSQHLRHRRGQRVQLHARRPAERSAAFSAGMFYAHFDLIPWTIL